MEDVQNVVDDLVDQVSGPEVSENITDVEMCTVEEGGPNAAEAFRKKIDSEIKELMEVDIPPDDKENIINIVRQLSRKELEDIILKKMVEAINSHSVVGNLRAKILSLYNLKDKLFLKSTALNKQASELSKAVKSIADNEARNPKPAKPQPPLRFYRSVGLQVSIDPKAHITGPNKTNHWKNGSWSSGKTGKIQSTSPTPGLIPLSSNNQNSSSSPLVKRTSSPYKQPNVSVTAAEMSKQVQNMNRPIAKKVTTPLNVLRQPTNLNQLQQVPQMRNPAAQAASNALAAAGAAASKLPNGNTSLVDLTDDAKQNVTAGNVIIGQNGVQYRIVNNPGMQLVQSPTGYQFVSQSGQTRPLILAPHQPMQALNVNSQQRSQLVKPNSPIQMLHLRNVAPKPLNSTPRSIIIPHNNVMGNLGGANRLPMSTVVSRGNLNSVINISPKKFVLPPLPPPSLGSQIVSQVRRVKEAPSRPELSLQEQNEGIVLSWSLNLGPNNAEVQSYQIYACQEPLSAMSIPKANQWKRVGDVKALPLPMACTLSQFSDENRYHFIVRGVDVYNRTGQFCEPVAIVLKKKH